jgi:hypothetical protein
MKGILNFINGIYFPPFVTQERLDELTDFPLQPDDVFIVTFPKCGTTWCQQIVKLIKQNGEDIGVNVVDEIPFMELVGKGPCMAVPSPRAFKSHLPYHMVPGGEPAKSVAKYIYVARNPKDAAVSLYYHMLNEKYMDETVKFSWNYFIDDYFIKSPDNECIFGSWFDHTLEWWKHKDASNILFIKYEDMKKDLRSSVVKIAQFMGHQLDDDVIDRITEKSTFDSMKASPLANPDGSDVIKNTFKENATPFLRKGTVGDWRNHFSDEQSLKYDEEYAKRMAGSGLEFAFD